MSEPGTWNIPEIPEGDDSDIEEVADSLFGSEIILPGDDDDIILDLFDIS
jgi:hypothetical protein